MQSWGQLAAVHPAIQPGGCSLASAPAYICHTPVLLPLVRHIAPLRFGYDIPMHTRLLCMHTRRPSFCLAMIEKAAHLRLWFLA